MIHLVALGDGTDKQFISDSMHCLTATIDNDLSIPFWVCAAEPYPAPVRLLDDASP